MSEVPRRETERKYRIEEVKKFAARCGSVASDFNMWMSRSKEAFPSKADLARECAKHAQRELPLVEKYCGLDLGEEKEMMEDLLEDFPNLMPRVGSELSNRVNSELNMAWQDIAFVEMPIGKELPPRGTGLETGRAGERREGKPRTEEERRLRHWGPR